MRKRIAVVVAVLLGCPAVPVLAAPDVVHAEASTGASPAAVAFGEDGRLGVIANTGDGTLSLLDTADPAGGLTTETTCAAPLTVAQAQVSTVAAVLVGCEDGEVARYSYDGSTLPATWAEMTSLTLSTPGDVLDLAVTGTDAYALTADGLVFHLDLLYSTEDTTGDFPYDVGTGAVALAASADGTALAVALDDGTLTELALDGGSVSETDVATGEADLVDVDGDGPFYALSSAGNVLSYATGSGAATALGSVASGAALAAFLDQGTATVGVLGGGALSFLDASTGASAGSAVVSGGASAVAITDDGYALAVDPAADLAQLLTGNPWVRIDGVTPESVTDTEETVTLTVTSDTAGGLMLMVGGDVDGSGTEISADVSTLTADAATAVSFSASALSSGDNLVFAFVMDDGFAIGRAAVVVRSDVSSGVPAPEAFAAIAGNGKVTLTWAPLDEDGVTVSHYVVYFADSDFDPLEGDPGFCSSEDDELCSGITVDHPDSIADAWAPADDDTGDDDTGDDDTGDDDDTSDDDSGDDDTADDDESVTLDLSPLTNGTTYYFTVAAVTSDETLGDFTSVVSAMPQETGGAAWLAGEKGGYGCDSCAVGGSFGGGAMALGLLLLAVIVRRTREER